MKNIKTIEQILEEFDEEFSEDKFYKKRYKNNVKQFLTQSLKETLEQFRGKERDNAKNCYCDSSGSDLSGYCNCEFSYVSGFNQAVAEQNEKIKEFLSK